jgi:hypothetical protein
MVVGTIVLCCGLIAVGSVVQVGATLWAGTQVKALIERDEKRDESTDTMRAAFIKFSGSQAAILRKVCLNTMRTDKDLADCLVPTPDMTPASKSTSP